MIHGMVCYFATQKEPHMSKIALAEQTEQTTTERSDTERKSERRRWIALGVLCMGQLMMVLDATIVNVALPSIQRDLHFTQGNLTWVIDGYLHSYAVFCLTQKKSK